MLIRLIDDDTLTAMWITVELNLSIVSACLPTLRPLILRITHGKAEESSPYAYETAKTKTPNQVTGSQGTQMEVFRVHDDTAPFVRLPSSAAQTEV